MTSFNQKPGIKLHCFPGVFSPRGTLFSGHPEAGFTLIEMMIVVAIIAILSALAFPSLSDLLPRSRTKAATRELRGYIQKAKLEAIKQNRDCLLVFTPASGTDAGSCVTCISSDDDCTDPGDDIISQLDFNDYKNAALLRTTFSGDKFVFNARGIPESTTGAMAAGRAVIENSADTAYTFDVIVASSGRVKIE